ADRPLAEPELFYSQPLSKITHEQTDREEVIQAKLNLIYQTNAYYLQENYFAFQVLNGLFGGFPHSKLFMNIREKESMAYYVSSSLDTFRGMMMVQTGIQTENRDRVLQLISEQLDTLRTGDISLAEIEQ